MQVIARWIEHSKRALAAVLAMCMLVQFTPLYSTAQAQQPMSQPSTVDADNAWEQSVLELFGFCADGKYFAAGAPVSAACIFQYVYFSAEMRPYEDPVTGSCTLSYSQYYAIVDRYFPNYNPEELENYLRQVAECDDENQTIRFAYYGSGGGVEWRFCDASMTDAGYRLRGIAVVDTAAAGTVALGDGWYAYAPVELLLSSSDPNTYQILAYEKGEYYLTAAEKGPMLYPYTAAGFGSAYYHFDVECSTGATVEYNGDVLHNADGVWYNAAQGCGWSVHAADGYVVGRVWYNDVLTGERSGTVPPQAGKAKLFVMPGVLFTVEAEHADVNIVMGMESYVDNTYLYCDGAAVELVVTPEDGYEVLSVMVGDVQAVNPTGGTTYMAGNFTFAPGAVRVTTRLIGSDDGDGEGGTGGNTGSGEGTGGGSEGPGSGEGTGGGSEGPGSGNGQNQDTTAPQAVIFPDKPVAAVGAAITLSGVNSTDNVKVTAYHWNYGDGTTGSGASASHIYTKAGTYKVKLTVFDAAGNTASAQTDLTVCDVAGENATHALAAFTVLDGYVAGTPAIAGAAVSVTNEAGFEVAGTTDAAGVVQLVVPRGGCTISVMADGYVATGRSIRVVADESGCYSYTVSMLGVDASAVDGYITTNAVSPAEMEAVGIDTSALGNQQVTKVKLTVNFKASATTEFDFDYDCTGYFDEDGKYLGGTGWGWTFWDWITEKDEDDDYEVPDIDPIDPIKIPEWLTEGGKGLDVGVFPISENFFLVVYGEAHWLKEMYNVELLVVNNSYAESITDCTATLQLPEGLSLATMLDTQQTAQIQIGTVAAKDAQQSAEAANTASVNWYVRGDAQGEYLISAHVDGNFANANGIDKTPFAYDFTAKDPVKIYAGSALKLTIRVQDVAFRGERYYMEYILENVSDKNIYGLSFCLTETEQYEAILNSDKSEEYLVFTQDLFKDGQKFGIRTLCPGEKISLKLNTTTWFNKMDMEFTSSVISGVEIGYFLQNVMLTTLGDSTTSIPYEVEIVKVDKPDLGEWIWGTANDKADEEVEETIEGTAIKTIDQVLFGGIPIVKFGLKVLNFVNDNYTMKDADSQVMITVSDGAYLTTSDNMPTKDGEYTASGEYAAQPLTYGLRRRSVGSVAVYTDGEYTLSPDGRTMAIDGNANIYILRQGEGNATVDIAVPYLQNHLTDDPADDEVCYFTYRLTGNGSDDGTRMAQAVETVLQKPAADSVEIPADVEKQVRLSYAMIDANGDFMTDATNAVWQVESDAGTQGVSWSNGVFTVDSTAAPGSYRLVLGMNDRDEKAVQTITLTGGNSPSGGNTPSGGGTPSGGNTPSGDENAPTVPGSGGSVPAAPSSPVTGDNFSVVWVLLLFGSAVCVIVLLRRRGKK